MSNSNAANPIYFDTITQYDKRFDELWMENPTVKKGLACPYFSIFTADMFMNNGETDKNVHESNIESAINANILIGTNDEMDFKQLISYTDLSEKDIGCTLAELIQIGEFKLEELFTSNSEKYCIIFLKNAKFFVVLCDTTGYYIRDAHDSVQYAFSNKTDMIDKLNTAYQFNCIVDVGGVVYGDYSSIEYVKIEHKFNNILNSLVQTVFDDTFEKNNDEMVKAIAESLNHQELDFDNDSDDNITDISDTE
jgi:hypothetical protein